MADHPSQARNGAEIQGQAWQPPVVERISIRDVTKLGLILGDDLIIIGSGDTS